MKQKVLAYIIQDDRLLVFRHTQFPEAGIQVPGGTVEQGEAIDHPCWAKRLKRPGWRACAWSLTWAAKIMTCSCSIQLAR